MEKPEVEIHILETWDDVVAMMEYVDSEDFPIMSLDIETDSASEKKATIYGVGLSFQPTQAFYIPIKRPDGSLVVASAEQSTLANWIKKRAEAKGMIGHNVLYDVLVIERNWGVDLSPDIKADTILMKHCIDEERPHGLKETSVKYLGAWADQAQDELKNNVLERGGRWNNENKDMFLADTAILGKYCAFDTILSHLLFNLFDRKIDEQQLRGLFEEEVMPLYREVTIDMKRKGFHVDVAHFQKLESELKERITAVEAEIQEEIADSVREFCVKVLEEDFPVKNSGNFPKALAKTLDLPLPTNAKTGKVTLSEKAVRAQLEKTPEGEKFYKWVLGEETIENAATPEQLNEARIALYFEKNEDSNYIFNLSSNHHLAWLFFSKMGFTPIDTTEGGAPTVDDDFVESIRGEAAFVDKLLDYKKLNKLLSTYVQGILERQIDGVIYASMLQFGTTSGRFSSTNPNCLSLDTEILTPTGFKKYNEIEVGDEVAGFDGSAVVWQEVKKHYLSDRSEKSIVSIKNEHMDMRLTANHRVIYKTKHSNKLKECSADRFPKWDKILHGANSDFFGLGVCPNFLRFLVACQADCEIREDSSRLRFVFKKERKFVRLREILDKLNYKYETKTRTTRAQYLLYEVLIDGAKEEILAVLGYEKTFPDYFIQMSKEEREIFLDELFYWDGLSTRKNNYSSNNEKNIDIAQALFALHGWRAHKRAYRSKQSKFNNFQLDITRRDYSYSNNVEIEKEKSCEQVWCVSVPSGKILVRRGSDTFITGNCQNLPRIKDDESKLSELVLHYTNEIKRGFVAPPGYVLVNADYSALEPRAFAHTSNDPLLQQVFHDNLDLYSQVAIQTFGLEGVSADKKAENYLGSVSKEKRQIAKTIALAITYGAEAGRIADLLKIDYREAAVIINNYLDAFPGLREYIKRQRLLAKTRGMVKSQFGRIRHLPECLGIYKKFGDRIADYKWANANGLTQERRKFKNCLNNSTNFPIQSLAAHIVNRAMIAISKEFKRRGIDGYIIMQVHDEVTCVARKDQAEQAKAIVKQCMEDTTKLSVPLVAEPVIADNWADAK